MFTALKKIFLLVLMPETITIAQQPNLQVSINDSLKHSLIYFEKATKDERLIEATKKAESIVTRDQISDSLFITLLRAEKIILNILEEGHIVSNSRIFDRAKVFSFMETVVRRFNTSTPQEGTPYYASALNNLGTLHHIYNEKDKALLLFQRALDIRKKLLGEAHADYAESLYSQANLTLGTADSANMPLIGPAMHLVSKAIAIKKILKEEDDCYAKCLFLMGMIYKVQHDYHNAGILYRQELDVREKMWGEQNPHYALRLAAVGQMFIDMYEYNNALPLFLKSLEIIKNTIGEENAQYVLCLNNLGSYYYQVGDYEEALPYFENELSAKEKLFGEYYLDVALSAHNLATTYRRMGKYEKAFPLSKRAVAISLKSAGKISNSYAYFLPQLASLYQVMGQYDEALLYSREALEINRKVFGERHSYYATCLENLALLHDQAGKYDSALAYLQKSQRIVELISGNQSPTFAVNLHNRALLYQKMGRFDSALNLFRNALQIRTKKLGAEHSLSASSLNSIGELYLETRNYDSAVVYLKKSLSHREKILGKNHPDYISSLNNAGLLALAEDNTAGAADLFVQSNSRELEYISRMYTSLSESQKMALINDQVYQFNYLPSLLHKYGSLQPEVLQIIYKNELALKGIVLVNQQNVLDHIRQKGDKTAMQLHDQLQINKMILGKEILKPMTERVNHFDSLQEITSDMEQQLSSIASDLTDGNFHRIISASNISNRLKPGEAAIEFLRFNYYDKKRTAKIYYAAMILLAGDSSVYYVSLFEENELKRLFEYNGSGRPTPVDRLYPAVIARGNTSLNYSQSLYRLIWKPLEKYLDGISTIYYAPAGLLNRISFQALHYNDNNLLIEKYQLNQLLSTRSLALTVQAAEKPTSINIWGNIAYNYEIKDGTTSIAPSFERKAEMTASSFNFYTSDTRRLRGNTFHHLPGTKLEADSLQLLFSKAGILNNSVRDTLAIEETFRAYNGNSPPVLHLATHGFSLPVTVSGNAFLRQQNPMFRSGLVLAGGNHTWRGKSIKAGREDGILTAYEIAQMDLSKTNLVVLSACETALGDLHRNEGVIGLQRAFRMAGVKQMIISLWEVPDKQTVELMTSFYRNWLNGQSTREALRSAQLTMKQKYSPRYWAAFVLVE